MRNFMVVLGVLVSASASFGSVHDVFDRIRSELRRGGVVRQAVVPGATLACVASTRREVASLGFRKSTMVTCGSITGEIRGALVAPNGVMRCGVQGVFDPDGILCGQLVVCGRTFPECP